MSATWECEFDHGFEENFLYSADVLVGPTTSLYPGSRGTLPQASPSNSNSIFVAPNGNDSTGTGDVATPYLTITKAITHASFIAGTRPTIHLFNNGFSSINQYTITEPDSVALIASRNIQCAFGDIATVAFPLNKSLVLSTTNKLNGLRITSSTNASTIPVPLGVVGTGCTIDNCLLEDSTSGKLARLSLTATCTSVSISFSILGQIDSQCTTASGLYTCTITNCVIINRYISDYISNVQCLKATPSNGVTLTFNISKSILITEVATIFGNDQLYHSPSLIYISPVGTTTSRTINFYPTGCHFSAPGKLFDIDNLSANIISYNYTMDYCLRGVPTDYQHIGTDKTITPTQGTLVETNSIDPKTNPLYIDLNDTSLSQHHPDDTQTAFYVYYYGTAVQRYGAGNVAETAVCKLTSSLLSTTSPWTFSFGLTSPVVVFPKNTLLQWIPSGFKETFSFINSEQLNNIEGSLHTAFDARQRTFTFTYDEYSNNGDFRRLLYLLNDTKPIRFYPMGKGNTLFIDPTTGYPDATNGTFYYDNTKSYPLLPNFYINFYPNITSGVSMIPGNWKGFYLKIGSKHFYIADNTDNHFMLEDTFIDNFTSPITDGSIQNFIIDHILVRSIQEDIAGEPSRFIKYINREQLQDDTIPFEYQGHSISFQEIGGHGLWQYV